LGRLSEKRESVPLVCVVPPQKPIFCGADFGCTIASDQGSSGPRRDYDNNENKTFTKNFLIWQNVTYPETITLRKMSGLRTVV